MDDKETKSRCKLMALERKSLPSPTLAPSFKPERGSIACCEHQTKSESPFANIQKQSPLAGGGRDHKGLMLIQIYKSKCPNLLSLQNTCCFSEPLYVDLRVKFKPRYFPFAARGLGSEHVPGCGGIQAALRRQVTRLPDADESVYHRCEPRGDTPLLFR